MSLPIGTMVRLGGLKARPDLNSKTGTVIGLLRDSGRLPVCVEDEKLLLKPENLSELELWDRGRMLWDRALRTSSPDDLAEAVRLLVTSIDREEHAPSTEAQSQRCLFVGYCRSDAQLFDEAITYLGKAIALDPWNAHAWRELLLTYESDAKDLEGARALVKRAVAGEANPVGWSTGWQRPGTMVPGLEAKPFWEPELFPWVARLEAFSSTIRNELDEALSRGGWPAVGGHHRASGASDGDVVVGDWHETVLLGNGAAPAVAPRTVEFLEREVPACVELCRAGAGEVIFSWLQPGTPIKPHCAPTNLRLTAHLGLKVPSGPSCRIRVGEEWRCWEEGKVLLFDDSFEHEVENKTNELRVVLLIRFFHPALMEASEGARHVALQQASANQTAAERGRYECPP